MTRSQGDKGARTGNYAIVRTRPDAKLLKKGTLSRIGDGVTVIPSGTYPFDGWYLKETVRRTR